MADPIKITVDGKVMEAKQGEDVAAAGVEPGLAAPIAQPVPPEGEAMEDGGVEERGDDQRDLQLERWPPGDRRPAGPAPRSSTGNAYPWDSST